MAKNTWARSGSIRRVGSNDFLKISLSIEVYERCGNSRHKKLQPIYDLQFGQNFRNLPVNYLKTKFLGSKFSENVANIIPDSLKMLNNVSD